MPALRQFHAAHASGIAAMARTSFSANRTAFRYLKITSRLLTVGQCNSDQEVSIIEIRGDDADGRGRENATAPSS
jgi:hypothetical protein